MKLEINQLKTYQISSHLNFPHDEQTIHHFSCKENPKQLMV